MVGVLVGFIIAWNTAVTHIQNRRKDAFLMQMEEEARMVKPSDGARLARLVPPELRKAPPEGGPSLYLEGREDFSKPPHAPQWAVMGQPDAPAGVNPWRDWYGATDDARATLAAEQRNHGGPTTAAPPPTLPPSAPGEAPAAFGPMPTPPTTQK